MEVRASVQLKRAALHSLNPVDFSRVFANMLEILFCNSCPSSCQTLSLPVPMLTTIMYYFSRISIHKRENHSSKHFFLKKLKMGRASILKHWPVLLPVVILWWLPGNLISSFGRVLGPPLLLPSWTFRVSDGLLFSLLKPGGLPGVHGEKDVSILLQLCVERGCFVERKLVPAFAS